MFNVVCCLFSAVSILSYAGQEVADRAVAVLALFIILFTCFFATCCILCKRALTETLIVPIAVILFVGCLLQDLSARSTSNTVWPMVVLLVDFLLVMQVQERVVSVLVVVMTCWLLLLAAEDVFRFGLLDVPGLVPQEGDGSRREYLDVRSHCTDLPCPLPVGASLRLFLIATSVFIIDFIATRGFARDVLKEQASMERTINAVQEIATLLAGYDVEQVAALLEQHEHELPVGMTVALWRLEQNLRVYKAYLPATCLPFAEEEDTDTSVTQVSSTSSSFSGGSVSSTHTGGSRRAASI